MNRSMEECKLRSLLVVVMVVAATLVGAGQASDTGSFKDCYIKCYVFCIIEPSQTLCSCTTQCFKNCILPGADTATTTATTSTVRHKVDHKTVANQSYAFCKFGCASSLCSYISTDKNPNGDNMERCVGSCSQKCSNYSPSSSSSP